MAITKQYKVEQYTDTSLMPFGLHKGKRLIDVPAKYLLYLHSEGNNDKRLMDYVKDNMFVLETQAYRDRQF